MNNYKDLQEQFSQDIFDNADKQEKEAYKLQKQNQEELLNLIAKALLTYTIADTILSLGDREKSTLRGSFNSAIAKIVKNELNSEKDLINNILTKVVKDKYYINAYITELGYSFDLQVLTDKQIKEVVDETIEGEVWSDRLWSNKKALETNLKQEIERFLQGKTDVNKIGKVIKDRFNQNAFNTNRLVQTEVAKCQSASNDVFAQENGVQWQMFTATLDTKTSDFCRSHDGKKYRIDDNNKPIPPIHPFCRSVLINLPSEDWTPKTRRVNSTGETINYKTYEEWKNENNID